MIVIDSDIYIYIYIYSDLAVDRAIPDCNLEAHKRGQPANDHITSSGVHTRW
jgi:hypothetical protein